MSPYFLLLHVYTEFAVKGEAEIIKCHGLMVVRLSRNSVFDNRCTFLTSHKKRAPTSNTWPH